MSLFQNNLQHEFVILRKIHANRQCYWREALRATHDENTTAIGEIASGLAVCADDIAMHRM